MYLKGKDRQKAKIKFLYGKECYKVKEKGATTKPNIFLIPTLSFSLQPNMSPMKIAYLTFAKNLCDL